MGEELSLDSILGADEIETLFDEEIVQETPPEEKENLEKSEETTEVVDSNNLFDETPESVGSEEEIEEKEGTKNNKGDGTSPNKDFYSSIANALKEEGIFPDLDDEAIKATVTPEDFRELIDNQIRAGIEERNRRIDEALGVGVEPTEIKRYENTINYLNSINEEAITNESDRGELLRKQLIYQDFINRGYSKERAEREVNKSFTAGSDIEDAKEALASNKDFFEKSYDNLIKEAKEEEKREEKQRKEQAEQLKKSILEDKVVFGEIQLDSNTRRKIFDSISKPVYKDPDTGEFYTAIQKYEKENRIEFLKNVGLLFTLTDGFKNIDKLVKGRVRNEVKKGLRELENTLNNTARTSDGNLRYVSGVGEDSESNARGWDLDI